MALADPVSMSYIRAPRLHQSTARLCPLRTRISGALGDAGGALSGWGARTDPPKFPPVLHPPHMYSMVPQKVWVTAPSWMDSLHSPKSVSLMWPEGHGGGVSTAPREPPRLPSLPPKPTLAVEHDILRLKVPVDDPVGMQVTQGQRDLAQVEAVAGLGWL